LISIYYKLYKINFKNMKKTKEGKDLKKIEEETFFQIDEGEVPPDDVIAYNELRSASDLNRMHNDKTLTINPDFQRNFVWPETDQTRFIDSLIKQLPIPSMCFSLDYKSQKWQVIDGLQRMSTITKFLNDPNWTLSKTKDIDNRIAGKTTSEIKSKFPDLYKRVENLTLPITILRCDYTKKKHSEYIFMIFNRLNTGGLKLNNQEIRNAVYQGAFNEFLKECALSPKWKVISGNKKDLRFKTVELILRFFAFYGVANKYEGKLSSFLNDYMHDHRFDSDNETKRLLFDDTVGVLEKINKKMKKINISNTVLEGLLYGVAKNVNTLKNKRSSVIEKYYKKLINSKSFSEQNIREGILKKSKVIDRLKTAEKIFSGK